MCEIKKPPSRLVWSGPGGARGRKRSAVRAPAWATLSLSLYVTQRARTVPVAEEERAHSETSSPARPPQRTRGTKKEAKTANEVRCCSSALRSLGLREDPRESQRMRPVAA